MEKRGREREAKEGENTHTHTHVNPDLYIQKLLAFGGPICEGF